MSDQNNQNYLQVGYNNLLQISDSLAFTLGENIQDGSETGTITTAESNGSVETMPVKTQGGIGDLWITNFIKSKNWQPKTVGFYLDGQTGYAEFANVFISGGINATTGTIGGWTINTTSITSTGVILSSSGDAYLAFGTTPPTSPTVGTGIFINKTGLFGLAANVQNFKIDATNGKITATGGIIDGTSTIGGRIASTLASAINSSGNFIDANFDTSNKNILSGFSFGSTDYSGALKTGTITWNASTGAITGGSGIVINKAGIVGAASGVTTFSIDGTTGNATYAGTITASQIVAGTLTGFTIQTAATNNNRVAMKAELYSGGGDASLVFYNSANSIIGGISAVNDDGLVHMTMDVGISSTIEVGLGLNASANTMSWTARSGGGVYSNVATINGLGDFTITGDLTVSSGNISVSGTVDGVDISSHAGNASAHHSSTSNGLSITPADITSGNILPNSSNDHDLGSTSYYWQYLYCDYVRFNSTYGRIYWGSTIVLDFQSGYVTLQSHLYPYSGNSYDLGSDPNGYWRDLYVTSVMANSRLNLKAKSSHSYAAGDIINWASGATYQFRGRPGDGTWDGSFDMTAI